MAVSKGLADALSNRYGTVIPGQNAQGVATSKTATATKAAAKPVVKAKAPNIWEKIGEGAKNIAQAADKAIVANAPKAVKAVENFTKQIPAAEAKSKADRAAQLKEEFKYLDVEAREVLKKNAFPTKDGFILPSTTSKDLAKFEGLKFTNEEWKNYSAKFATPQTLNMPNGTERKASSQNVNPSVGNVFGNIGILAENIKDFGKSEEQKELDFWKLTASQREADVRREERAKREQAAGFDYLAKLRASQGTDDYANWDTSITPDSLIKDLGDAIKFGPAAPFMLINKQIDRVTGNNVARATNEFGKSVAKTSMEVVSGLASGIEEKTGENTYLKFINDHAAQVADDWKIKVLQNPQLNRDISVPTTFGGGGYMDPAWYASTGGQVIPHALASMAASVTGGLAAGPAGAAAGAFAYGSTIETGSMYDMMIEEGYSLQEAREASRMYGTIAGTLDSIVPGEIGGRLINSASKKLLAEAARETTKDTLTQAIKKVGWTTFKEASTEGAQQIAQNITLGFYDKTQDVWENVLDSFVGGALGGGVFSGFDVRTSPDVSISSEEVNGASPIAEAAGENGVAQTANKSTPASQQDNVTKDKIKADIASLLDASRAQEASVVLGEQLQIKFPENETIKQLTEEAREGIKEMNRQADVLMQQFADTTKQTIVDQAGVQIALGTTPDGRYTATGRVEVAKSGFSVPFSTDETFASKEAAVASVATKISSYVTQKLSSSGIANTQQAEAIIQTLSGTIEGVSNLPKRTADVAKYASQDALYTELNDTPISRLDMAVTPKEYYIDRVSTQAYKSGVKNGEVQGDITLKQYQYRNRARWNEMYKQALDDANVSGITRDALASAFAENEKRFVKNGVNGVQSKDKDTNTKTMSDVDAKLMEEAKKYKTLDAFLQKMGGGSTQYGDYTPDLRINGLEGYQNITELGIPADQVVTVYRGIADTTGTIKKEINDGDFVTTDFDSALSYAGYKENVVSVDVQAKDLYVSEPRDFEEEPFYIGAEYVYTKSKGSSDVLTEQQLTDIWNAAQAEEPKTNTKTMSDAKLMEEAKKYKTAKEFESITNVLATANPLFRKIQSMESEAEFLDYLTTEFTDTDLSKLPLPAELLQNENVIGLDGKVSFEELFHVIKNIDSYYGDKNTQGMSGGGTVPLTEKVDLESLWNEAQTEEPKANPKKEERDREVSRVSQRMASEYPELTSATFETVNLEEQIAKAVDTIAKDKQEAFRIAMGVTDAPNYESIAVNIAMTEKALEEGNFELAQQLITNRSLRQTEAGQSIVMERASITDNSPQKYMREILNTRLSNLGAKYLSGLTDKTLHDSPQKRAIAKIKEEVAAAKKKISKKKQFDLSQAQDFISSLACK